MNYAEKVEVMNLNRFRNPLGILLIIFGAGFLLTACSQQIPIIPITAFREITPAATWIRVFMGIIGMVLLVAGFSLVKILIQVIGFFGGGAAGMFLAQSLWPGVSWAAIAGFGVGAIIGVVIALTATGLGVFAAGAMVGIALAQQVWPYVEGYPAPWLGVILCAIIGGILTVWLFNFWVAALTAILGAVLLGMALGLRPVYWIALGLVGVLIQTVISRQKPVIAT